MARGNCCRGHAHAHDGGSMEDTAGGESGPAAGDQKTVFLLQGLDCGGCAEKLEKVLAATDGIKAATVQFAAGKAVVTHTLTDAAVVEVIRRVGYTARPETERPEITPWRRQKRLWTTAAAGLCWAAAMVLQGLGQPAAATLLFAATMLIGGLPVARSGLYALRQKTMDTNFLMLIAAVGAVLLGQWSEGAIVVFLFSAGNALQAYTVDKTRRSVQALLELAPREATVRRDGRLETIAADDVAVGDTIVVKPGEKIALDGVVRLGASAVNEAAVTGESMSAEKNAGDAVYAGTVNGDGVLEITVTKPAADSTISKIMHMVEAAQSDKAPLQQQVDIFARYYTPAIVLVAALIALAPPFIWNQPWEAWLYRALVLLVISCPCALVLSTPVSIVAAIGRASRLGALIKGGAYLEHLGKVKAIAFDKTGTLTRGRPSVVQVIAGRTHTKDELVAVAAAVEQWSEHPLAQAIMRKAASLTLPESSDGAALVGRGAQAQIDGATVYVGSGRLFEELGAADEEWRATAAKLADEGLTAVLVGDRTAVWGLIAIADTVREQAETVVRELREAGMEKIVMLTGDNRRVARSVAGPLGLNAYYSELLPGDKAAAVKEMQAAYGRVAMVGDGVNDAPALATADIGVAMGAAGSDAALETADVALLADDLSALPQVIRLSRRTVAIIRQNIVFSILIKLVFILSAIAGDANLWLAVFADTGASILVTLNGMRLAGRR